MRNLLIRNLSCSILLLLAWPQIVSAQSDLKDENRATIFVEIDFKKLRENTLFKEIGLEALESELRLGLPPIDTKSITRIVFAAQCKDFETFESYDWQSDLPYSFYFRVSYDSPNAVDNLRGPLESLPPVEIEGKTFYRPPAESNVENCLIYIDDTDFLFGSDDYVLHGSHNFLTEKLQQQLDVLPDDRLFRGVIDCVAGKDFLKGMIESPSGIVPPESVMFIKPFLNLNSLGLAADIENSNLLKLNAQSPDEEMAKKFQGNVSQMLNMGKVAVSMLGTMLETDEQRETFSELVSQLKAEQDGTTVSVDINQPEGFIELVSAMTLELRRSAMRTNRMNNVRQIALSVHNYESAMRRFPFVVKEDGAMSAGLSWRARVLPYLEYGNISDSMDMSEPWDHESNKVMVDRMPDVFGDDGKLTQIVWIKSNVETFADITDGTSNTVMLLVIPDGIPWLEPKDLRVLDAIKLIKNLDDGQKLLAARYDGSVFTIDNTLSHNQLRALFSPAGGEVIDFDQ